MKTLDQSNIENIDAKVLNSKLNKWCINRMIPHNHAQLIPGM